MTNLKVNVGICVQTEKNNAGNWVLLYYEEVMFEDILYFTNFRIGVCITVQQRDRDLFNYNTNYNGI